MKARSFAVLLSLLLPIAGAATLRVGPGEAHLTIQSAIDAAAPGDVIEVAPGLYAENLIVNKAPLALRGARAGVDARGRVPGAANPAVESLIAPASGVALEIASADGQVVVSGFVISGAPAVGNGLVVVATADAPALQFTENDVRATAGSVGSLLRWTRTAENATLSRNVFSAAASTLEAIHLDATASFDGLHFLNNHLVSPAPTTGTGISAAGDANVGASSSRNPLLSGNRFAGFGVAIDGGSQAFSQASFSSNTFEANGEGLSGGLRNCAVSGNLFKDNTGCGIRLTARGNTAGAGYGATGTTIEENVFQNNGTVSSPSGHGDLCFDDQAAGTQTTNLVRRNKLGSSVALFSSEAGETIQAAFNYWGAADGPGGSGPGSGGDIAGSGVVDFQPWYVDADLTTLDFGGSSLEGSLTLGEGESIEGEELALAPAAVLTLGRGARMQVGQLAIGAGATLKIDCASAAIGQLTQEPGGVIEVVNGDLSLDPLDIGEYHTISGSFTFFNCLGSLDIHSNTTFSGSTLGLASDIHVAPGVTLIVTGSLILDGCTLESSGTYSVFVNFGSTFRMTRCEVTGASLSLVGSDLLIRDSTFTTSSLVVFSTVNGGSIYHNVFTGGTGVLNILPGAAVTTSVEGWSNVANVSAVRNQLALAFRTPSDPTRTLDAAGKLYVQPGDSVNAGLDISKLVDKTQAVEVLLGYSTDYLLSDSLLPSVGWDNALYGEEDESAVIGKFDTAVGLSFSYPDPDGTLLDGQVADLRLNAQPLEGFTRVFFRTKGPEDEPFIDTRLTVSSGGAPGYRNAPFTRNSAVLVVDGTDPVFAAGATATQIQSALPVDVLQDGVYTRQGTVTITFDAYDELAGVENPDVSVELVGSPATLPASLVSSSPVLVGDLTYTRYVFQVAVSVATPDGPYDVNAHVMDRSGNAALLAIGALEISKFRVNVTVALDSLVTAAINRTVVFVATNASGTVLATWTIPVPFVGGLGSTMIEGIPAGTANISAKTAWNLRRRLPASFDSTGLATVSFTGPNLLRGGDLNGNNVVTSTDYNIVVALFASANPQADINGNGFVNSTDYNILVANWLTGGDPP
ncbi:right-handed parallel beta-helix repeat-containing protein [Luteolibacter sp. Populi]|uniref:dockerin type I domain-containing protein n=1 Tax=Luteolibacter sp. Populi TaxID=3230487 RepID=UPI0034653AE0